MISNRERQLFIMAYIKSRLDGQTEDMLGEVFELSNLVFKELGIENIDISTVKDFIKLNNEFTTIAKIIMKQCNLSKRQ